MYSVKFPKASSTPARVHRVIQKQKEFWQEACKAFGPRGPIAPECLCSITASGYYKHQIPKSSNELAEIQVIKRKTEIESKWDAITKGGIT